MTPQPLADNLSPPDPARLAQSIKDWGRELGFQQVGISDVELGEHEAHLQRWLEAGYHGEMDYMAAHGSKRSRPAELVPGTLRVISLRMDYLPGDTRMAQVLATPEKAAASGQRRRKARQAAWAARCMSSKPGVPAAIRRASRSRTWAAE